MDAVNDRFVGESELRIEDAALLTGNGRFLGDLTPFPGTLEAAIVRSPYPHAKIVGFDASEALKVDGVATVVGPEEVRLGLKPFPLSMRTSLEYFPAAVDRVRYVGEPVAVVVATSRALAEDAAELVTVLYDPLPPVTNVDSAMAEGATLLHPGVGSNVISDRTFSFGDPDGAFANATQVVSGHYYFPRYSSTPMECYVVIANWQEELDGPMVSIHANFHGPFTMVPVVAGGLDIPLDRLRIVVPADIGGSFGIKSGVYPYMALIALASKHARRPVRWMEDRIEHLLASSAGNDRVMNFEAAVRDDATIAALRIDLIDNVGAYMRTPEPATLYRCFGNITGPYRIDSISIRARAVVTNQCPTGLNRGFGGQQLYFGLERTMDKVAMACGIDSAEVRRRNLLRSESFPYLTPTGGIYDSGDYHRALGVLLSDGGYEDLRMHQSDRRRAGFLYGIGLATVVDPSATNIGYVSLATPADERRKGRDKSGSTEHVRISVDPLGAVTVLLGSVPQGQGHATVARQIVADGLGLPLSKVRVVVEMDTATTPWTVTTGSYSSRFAPLVTSALVVAADKIADRVKAAASVMMGVNPADLELAEGLVRSKFAAAQAVPFRHAAGMIHWDPSSLPPGVEPSLYVEAVYSPVQARPAQPTDTIDSSLCYGFVGDLVAVEIDPDTLEVRIDRAASVHDSGTILNPALYEGQIHGAVAHGVGGALYEELVYDEEGQPRSSTFMDYLCPTAVEMDFPFSSYHLVSPSPFTLLGAKGVGEGSSMSFPVALANAITDVLTPFKIEIDRLPVHGGAIHDLLDQQSIS